MNREYKLFALQSELTEEIVFDLYDKTSDQHNYYDENKKYLGKARWFNFYSEFTKILGRPELWTQVTYKTNELMEEIKESLVKYQNK